MNTSSTFQSHENANQARNEHLHVESTNSIDSRRAFWAQNSAGTPALSGRLSGFLAAVLLMVTCNILTSCKHNPTGPTWREVSLTGVTPSAAAPGEKVLIHAIPVGDIDDNTVSITLNGVELAWTAVWTSVPDTEALVVTIPEGAVSGDLIAIAGNKLGIDTLEVPFKVVLNKSPFNYGAMQFRDLAWDGSKIVLVGTGGIITVDSALRAIKRSVFEPFYNIECNNGHFVALGNNRLASSSDGSAWSVSDLTFSATDIAWGGGQFIATSGNAIELSHDGQDWSRHQLDPHVIGSVSGVCWNNGTYFAVGYGPTSSLGYQGSVVISEDGSNWRRSELGFEYHSDLLSVAASSVGIVAAGYSGIVFSSDQSHWTSVTMGEQETWRKVIWTGSMFVVVGDASYVLTTKDGIHWAQTDNKWSMSPVSVCWVGTHFVAVGQDMLVGNFIPADTTF